uniref:Uncharacterized protein n=1 Tax=Solanum lycopersicum TaxID=4081 RepID=A0A3Q7H387_SOLLC
MTWLIQNNILLRLYKSWFYEVPFVDHKPHYNVYLSCVPIDSYNNTHVYLSEFAWCTELEGVQYISCPSKPNPTSCPNEALIILPLADIE